MAKTLDTTSENERKDGSAEEQVRYWINEIQAAKRREKKYRKEGQEILDVYHGRKSKTTPFNILYSNVETLMPALYSNVPRPVVERRFKDADPLGKAAAQAGQRMLAFLMDTNKEGYETFDEGMRGTVLDALTPGRGWCSIKYDADMTGDYAQAELVCLNTRTWDRVLHGYAKKWSKVPWVAYEEYLDKDECIRLFDAAIAGQLKYTKAETDSEEEKRSTANDERNKGERKTTTVYQVWDKDERKIRYVSLSYKDDFLKVEDDPLGLTGFFDCPRPMQFVEKSNDLLPTALYTLYENQARELNVLTLRISRVARAIKARGCYAADLGNDLGKLIMEGDDNELVPAESGSSLATEKGFQNAIWFLPIEQLIVVLEKLLIARESCKQTIYEITGISDIIRGSTKASETFGAQELKSQWGTLRLKRLQKEVQRYARDLLRLMLETAATKFSEDTWAKATGLPFLTTVQAQQLEMVIQAAQQASIMGNPQAQAQLQQLQQQAQAPKWADVLGLLKDDLLRAYRIDIETNSTIEPEAAEDQKQISELMMSLGQYLQGVAPLVIQGALPFEAAKAMLLAITRRFRFGSEIEEFIQQMQPPKPPEEDGGEKVKREKEIAQKDLELQGKKQAMDLELKKMDLEKTFMQKSMDLDIREMQFKGQQEQFAMEQQNVAEQHKMFEAVSQAKATGAKDPRQQKADGQAWATVMKGTQNAMAVVQELQKAVAQLADQQKQTQSALALIGQLVSAPRVKKAVRGPSGRIERVVEEVGAA